MASDGGTRLQERRQIIAGWIASKQVVLRGYQGAVRQDIAVISHYMFWDDQLVSLTPEEKELVVELYGLEQDVATITGT